MRIPVARRRLGMRIHTSKSGEPTGALDSNKHLHRLTEQGGTLLDPRQSSSLVNKLVIQCDRCAHSIPLHQTAHHDVVHDAEHQANGRGGSDRSRAEILPISTRNWTDLEPEADRSRHGTRPISSRKRTDLDAELDRSRRGTRPISAAAAAAGAVVSGAAVATVQGPWLSSVGQPFSVQPPSRVRLCCAMVGALRPAPAQYSCSCPRKCPTS